MKKILTVLAVLALTGSRVLAADKILKGDQFVVAGVNFPQPFQTPSGQVLKAGLYDLRVVSEGGEGVLIGLLKGGKQVGQLRGIVKAVPGDQVKAVPGDQNVKAQRAGIIGPQENKPFRDLGLTPASPVSFGGGLGKISNSNSLHPGAILPYIEFVLAPGILKTK